jgi:hypothetical protein
VTGVCSVNCPYLLSQQSLPARPHAVSTVADPWQLVWTLPQRRVEVKERVSRPRPGALSTSPPGSRRREDARRGHSSTQQRSQRIEEADRLRDGERHCRRSDCADVDRGVGQRGKAVWRRASEADGSTRRRCRTVDGERRDALIAEAAARAATQAWRDTVESTVEM